MKHALRNTHFLGGMLLLSQIIHPALVSAQLPTTPPAHIVILWEENYAYADIIGTPLAPAPHINALANDTNAALFTQFFAIEHPSQPNYLDMFSGSNQGITDDNYPTADSKTLPFTTPNLCAELLAASKTFKTYSQDLPSVGSDVATYTTGGADYARKHNPCANWCNSLGSGANTYSGTVNQPYTNFPSNFNNLPTVTFVVPNMDSDMHDGSIPANITPGDTWMFEHLDTLRSWSLRNNTLYIMIFDEDDDLHGNNIPVIFYGPMVKHGTYSNHETLVNLLGTIETMYGLGHAGSPFSATGSITNDSAITYCWQNRTSISTDTTGTTGVNNVANNNYTFKVMPNPASDVINFNCSAMLNNDVRVTIIDANGRLAGKYTMTGTNLQVNTSSFAAGVYSYSIMNNNGNKLDDGKFVITHN